MCIRDRQQVSHFNTYGFVILRQWLNPDELNTINAEVELRLSFTKRYTSPDDEPAYMSWPNLGPETPFLAGLPEDPRIYSTAEQLYGEDAVGLSCNAGSFVNETRWHPDADDFQLNGFKLGQLIYCLLYTSPSPRDRTRSRMPSSA